QASSASCPWTAAADTPWITVRTGGSGSGNGTVTYDVAAATGPPRTGTILAAGLRFAITQSEGCAFAIAPNSYAPGAAGGATTIGVTTAAACPWTAVSNVPWITVAQGATGTGAGTARLVVEGTAGPSRTGTVLVAGQTVTVTQGAGCSFAVAPLAQSFPSAGGAGSATVETTGGCAWSASSNVPWITLTGPTSGNNAGSIAFTVAPLTGAARTGTVSVAGADITISQGSGCSFAVTPTTTSVAAGGGTGSVSVTAGADCAWSASSGAAWLTVTSGANGSGNGTVQFSAAATTGGPRSGLLTVAGQTVTVNQDNGCAFAIAPGSATIAAGGGSGSVSVTTSAGCAWTATSNAPWITIGSGSSGSGTGTLQYTAASTTGGTRSGTLTIAGQTFTLTQGSGCSFSLSSTTANVPAGGGTGSVAVTSAAGCEWTATSNAPWLTITPGGSGSGNGNGTVQYSAAATTGGSRSGTLTIGGQTFTVTQGSGCTFALAPSSLSLPSAGGSSPVSVTAGAGCAWTATSGTSWLTIASGASGSGNGTVSITAAANPGVARSGTVTIAGQSYTVTQAGGCTFGAAPTTIAINALGGNTNVAVTAPGGCAWTSSSGVNWVTVSAGASGSGNGTTTLQVGINLGNSRSGSATVAGQTVTINQAATLCLWAINPSSRNAGGNGDTNTFAVTAGSGCPWTATSTVSWITVTSGGSGSGNGTVAYTVARNTTNVARAGTITVAGQTFTVNQAK
ncbi:MAG: BACON domain-containing carbohydrate-binding protein, partial [Vicinamibacterales bacterium]